MSMRRVEEKGREIASSLVPVEQIVGDDETDTALLREMATESEAFIRCFPWCATVLESFYGNGIGGIFAVFLIHIRPDHSEVDPWVWVMIGDVPPAYLPLTDAISPSEAFRTYMRGMSKWVELARTGRTGTSAEGVPPLKIPSTPEWAERVHQMLYGLTLSVQPMFEGDSVTTVQ